MTFINIDNSKSISVKPFSVQLKSQHGAVYWRSEDDISVERIAYQVLNLSHGTKASVSDARSVMGVIDTLLNFGDRSLYSVQSLLNGACWENCAIEIEVNAVHATGLAIGVKSIWQGPVTITYN